ncbi:unnamed protein product [Rhizophagus irregularis]|nr:unnamed protein product [Rhizophagus irregularis]
MSNSLSGKIFNFLTTSPLEHITAFSVIFQAMEEEPLIKQDALRNIVNNAVNLATNTYSNNILAQNKLLMVSMQFDVAYESVRSLRDIEISNTIESPISREEIAKNMRELKSKLKGKSSQLAVEMRQLLEKVNIDNLTWQKPLASQVISDDSDLVQDLTLMARQSFMKLAQRMQATLPPTIQEKCKTFIKDFRIENIDEFPQKLSHTGTWKEREEDLLQVTEEILDTLSNIWKNHLRMLNLRVKDYLTGEMMHLSVLIKDIDDVQRLYHLRSIIIPVQPTNAEILTHFVEALLVLKNITIVNNSLLFHASRSKSNRLRQKSSTVSFDKE